MNNQFWFYFSGGKMVIEIIIIKIIIIFIQEINFLVKHQIKCFVIILKELKFEGTGDG